jgi:hypothetical protein
VRAQTEHVLPPAKDSPAPSFTQRPENFNPQEYVAPTVENFAKLYWALNVLDTSNTKYVDNFIVISDCPLYRKNFQNEFEWAKIRQSAIASLTSERESYPTRFRFVLPLQFGEYVFADQTFELSQRTQIPGVRRFEFLADNYNYGICDLQNVNLAGYPRAVVAELSRPIELTRVPVETQRAQSYLEALNKRIGRSLLPGSAELYEQRKAYLVLYVKFFAHKANTNGQGNIMFSENMAVLEALEVIPEMNVSAQPLYGEYYRRRAKQQQSPAIPNNPPASN